MISAHEQAATKQILVIDDDVQVRISLKKALEHTGYRALLAADGLEARPRLESENVDLVILDLNMPRRDGWEVLDDINALAKPVPVIVLTALWDQLATFRMPGVSCVLSKPIEADRLLDQVARCLALSALHASSPGDDTPSLRHDNET